MIDKLLYYITYLPNRLKTIFAYLPVLWKDRDFDHVYLLKLMQIKLQRMHKNMIEDSHHTTAELDARNIKIAEQLLSRLTNSDFYWDLKDSLTKEEKALHCRCPSETSRFEDIPGTDLTKWFLDYCKYCEKRSSHWYKQSDEKQEADFKFLFEHFKKHLRRWWT